MKQQPKKKLSAIKNLLNHIINIKLESKRNFQPIWQRAVI